MATGVGQPAATEPGALEQAKGEKTGGKRRERVPPASSGDPANAGEASRRIDGENAGGERGEKRSAGAAASHGEQGVHTPQLEGGTLPEGQLASSASAQQVQQRVSSRFSSMTCLSPLSQAFLASLHFSFATPVQEACIPLLLAGVHTPGSSGPSASPKLLQRRDLAVEAPTGSGKTLAFVLPVVERLLSHLRLYELGRSSASPPSSLGDLSELIWDRERRRRSLLDAPLSSSPSGESDESLAVEGASQKKRTPARGEVETADDTEHARHSPEYVVFLSQVLERKPASTSSTSSADGEGENSCRIGAVLLAPTRELARQIFSVVQSHVRFVEETVLLHFDAAAAHQSKESRKRRRTQTPQGKEEVNAAADVEAGVSPGSFSPSSHSFFLQSMLLSGGTRPLEADLRALERRASRRALFILVATPGRLSRLVETERATREPLRWSFDTLDMVVVDEADRLMDEQHTDELRNLLRYLREKKASAQTEKRISAAAHAETREDARLSFRVAVFSATLAGAMAEQSKTKDLWGIVKDPVCIRVATPLASRISKAEQEKSACVQHDVPTTLSNFYAICDYDEKLPFLFDFIQTQIIPHNASCIVFLLTCHCVEYFYGLLRALFLCPPPSASSSSLSPSSAASSALHVQLSRLHGRMKQRARLAACKKFASSAKEPKVLLATDVAARGLDFPDVDWTLQIDPPQNPDVFVHRIGRAARAGRSGCALLLLLPHEDAYLPFLKNRGISIASYANAEGTVAKKEINEAAKNEVLQDRALVLKSSKAFVSFVRAYKEHQLSFLLPFQSLDLGRLATAFALLRLPRMKEIVGRRISNFTQSAADPLKIPFRFDSAREAERLAGLSEALEQRAKRHTERERKRENARKKQNEKEARADLRNPHRTKAEKRKVKRRNALDEWEELAFEERMARKLRKGKISEVQYEKELKKRGEQFAEDLSDVSGGDSDADSLADSDDIAGDQGLGCTYTGERSSQGRRGSDASSPNEARADECSDVSDFSDSVGGESDEKRPSSSRHDGEKNRRRGDSAPHKKPPKWIGTRGRKTKKKKWGKRK
ncbi:UNVERIFIED_CONTAM: DEAD/DEAH box helicase domain-containing protein [Hammondia hammondi]|eukprot:XP_008887480.1 DEAD/DEAH box helicase domain-containing protein [Hammondia hammondi]